MTQTELSKGGSESDFREGCAFLDGSDFGIFSISGKDAKDFLHRMLSNEIRNLAEGEGTQACLLNSKGRVELFFQLWLASSEYRVLIWGKQRAEFVSKLDRFLFTEEVKIEDRSDRDRVSMLCGPRSTEYLAAVVGVEIPVIEPNRSVDLSGNVAARLYRCDWAPVPVYLFAFPAAEGERVEKQVHEAGANRGDWSTFHTLRIEKGTAWPEFEVDDSAIPYECGLEGAVSLTKGCFVGQEIVARIMNLGESPRYLRGLVFEDSPSLARGSEVMAGEVHAGRILTVGRSERLGATIATSSLLRKTAEPGTVVEVEGQSAEVRMFPL